MNRAQVLIAWVRTNITRRPRRIRGNSDLHECWCPTHGTFTALPRGWSGIFICDQCFSVALIEMKEELEAQYLEANR